MAYHRQLRWAGAFGDGVRPKGKNAVSGFDLMARAGALRLQFRRAVARFAATAGRAAASGGEPKSAVLAARARAQRRPRRGLSGRAWPACRRLRGARAGADDGVEFRLARPHDLPDGVWLFGGPRL